MEEDGWEMKKKSTIGDRVLADVDDEMWLLKKRIELKYNITWAKARDAVNESIKMLYGLKE